MGQADPHSQHQGAVGPDPLLVGAAPLLGMSREISQLARHERNRLLCLPGACVSCFTHFPG